VTTIHTVILHRVLEHLDTIHRLFGEPGARGPRTTLSARCPTAAGATRAAIGPRHRPLHHFAHSGLPRIRLRTAHMNCFFLRYVDGRDFPFALWREARLSVVEPSARSSTAAAIARGCCNLVYSRERYHNRYGPDLLAVLAKQSLAQRAA